MKIDSKNDYLDKLTIPQKTIVISVLFISGILLFLLFPTSSVDWIGTFYPVSQNPLDPYKIKSFINPPWIGIILYPLHFFSLHMSKAINSSLTLVIIGSLVKFKKGNLLSIFLTLTSFPFISLLTNGGIEWIPAIGFFFQNGFGVFLLLSKPQCGILSATSWFFQKKNKFIFLLIPCVGIFLSFILWKKWIINFISNLNYVNTLPFGLSDWNASLFPWTIPIGLILLYLIIKKRGDNNELLGTLATFCFFPYFAPHSLTILFALISASYPLASLIIWLLLWVYPIITYLNLIIY